MKKLLLILLCLPLIGFGQWTYGGVGMDLGLSFQQTNDGGYIICGTTSFSGNGYGDIYLIKTDGNGVEQWSQTFGGTDSDWGYSVQETNDGGYIISGGTEYAFGDTVRLIKTDNSGNLQWENMFPGYYGCSVQQTNDGGYIVLITEETNGVLASIVKTDSNGNLQWLQNITSPYTGWTESIQQTSDGGYIITGHVYGLPNIGRDLLLIKTDGSGNQQWVQFFGDTLQDEGYSVKQTSDGGYIISGVKNYYTADIWLIKTDNSGNLQWDKTFGGTNIDYVEFGIDIEETNDGGYIITGYKETLNDGNDIWLIKTDNSGNLQWDKTFGGSGDDVSGSVEQTNDGGYALCGYTESFGNGSFDVILIKTDGNGNITSTFNIPINPNRKLQKTVDILGKQTKAKTNTPLIEIYDDGTVEKKIIIE